MEKRRFWACAKALSAAVKRHAGEAAVVQRCQVHKRRNVLDQLPEEYQPGIERKLIAAYAMTAEADARRALDQIHGELERINPSAARSLEEGMEETLTVHKLRPPQRELRNVMRARGRKSQRSSGHPPLKMHTGAQCGKISSKHRAGCLSPRAFGSLLWGHVQLRLLVRVFLQRSLLLVLCISLNSCQSHKANSGPCDRVHPFPAGGAGWTRKSRHDFWTGKKRSSKSADCCLCAQRAMVGAALAALPRIVTEIDDVAPVYSRTYRNIVSAVDVLRADRMPLFVKKFSSDSGFQQGCRRISGESPQDRHNRT